VADAAKAATGVLHTWVLVVAAVVDIAIAAVAAVNEVGTGIADVGHFGHEAEIDVAVAETPVDEVDVVDDLERGA